MPTIAAPPVNDSLVQTDPLVPSRRDPFFIAREWLVWLQDALATRVQQAPAILTSVVLTNQSASIGATPIPLRSTSAGLYRVSVYARITTVDAVSSSLTISIGWTESAIPLTLSGAAMTGNLVTTVQSFSLIVQADANAPLNYSTAYISNTPAMMKYRLTVTCESLN